MFSSKTTLSTRGSLLILVVLATVALVVYLYTVFRPPSDSEEAQCLLERTPKTHKTCKDIRHKDDCGDCEA